MSNAAVAALFAAIRASRAANANSVSPIAVQAAKLGLSEQEAQRAYDRAAGWPGNFQHDVRRSPR